MKLNDICNILQMKIIGHKGAIVECMNDEGVNFIKKGDCYKVLDIDLGWPSIYIGENRNGYKPERFRLVIN